MFNPLKEEYKALQTLRLKAATNPEDPEELGIDKHCQSGNTEVVKSINDDDTKKETTQNKKKKKNTISKRERELEKRLRQYQLNLQKQSDERYFNLDKRRKKDSSTKENKRSKEIATSNSSDSYTISCSDFSDTSCSDRSSFIDSDDNSSENVFTSTPVQLHKRKNSETPKSRTRYEKKEENSSLPSSVNIFYHFEIKVYYEN